jgi:hypothetical protein
MHLVGKYMYMDLNENERLLYSTLDLDTNSNNSIAEDPTVTMECKTATRV